jgi:nucleoid-associated protein YgaU
MFNPAEYTFSKHNVWTQGVSKGSGIGLYEFSSGQASTLQMQLFFNTYPATKTDVCEKYTKAVWKMMQVDPSLSPLGAGGGKAKGRPPVVFFQWGKTSTFKAVIVSISERLTLFLPDGTPVRSTLDVTFQQVMGEDAYPATNPTSGGVGGERVWTVNKGDTLGWIAYKEYGNANLWRLIADANRLTRVRKLTPGMMLEIPNV